SSDREMLIALAEAGMDFARFNFSHASHEEAARGVRVLREVAPQVALLGDLQGRKRRLGPLDHPLLVEEGRPLVLTAIPDYQDPARVSADIEVEHPIPAGAAIIVGDGAVRLEVTAHERAHIETVVTRGGYLTSRAGVFVT